MAVIGLGMAQLVDQSLAIPGQGELYQGTGMAAREFSLVGTIFGDGPGPRHIQSTRDDLIDAFKPDLTGAQQPMVIRYQALDEDGVPCSDTLDLVCTYQGALEGNWANHQREDVALQFKMYMPLIRNAYTSGVSLQFSRTVLNANYLLQRNTNGEWVSITSAISNTVTSIVKDNNNNLYIGGIFTNVGDANGDRIIKIAPDGTVSSLGTGMNDTVFALAIAPNGDLYAGGRFTSAGGVANTARIARWDGSAWNALSTGIGSGDVTSLVFDALGNLYIGGTFTNHIDANGDGITKWSGVAFSSLGTGVNSDVNSLAIDMSGNLYAAGAFTLAGGVAGTSRIAKWNGTAWVPLSTGVDGTVRSVIVGLDGSIYIGGSFSNAGSVSCRGIARWNGVKWSALGSGLNAGAIIYAMDVDPNGDVYVVGTLFTTAGGVPVQESIAVWNGSVWTPFDVILPHPIDIFTIWVDPSGNIYLGSTSAGSATAAVVTQVAISGSAGAYPVFVFTGPGTITEVKNFTDGRGIFFNLTLLAGETATLSLNPESISFTSNFRGNIMSTILPGSDLNFQLIPGSNNLSVFLAANTTAATKVIADWTDNYWSLDGAVVK